MLKAGYTAWIWAKIVARSSIHRRYRIIYTISQHSAYNSPLIIFSWLGTAHPLC